MTDWESYRLLAQIIGGILGIIVAWLINCIFVAYHNRQLEKIRKQNEIELINYKKTLEKRYK